VCCTCWGGTRWRALLCGSTCCVLCVAGALGAAWQMLVLSHAAAPPATRR
jgi:hypothetical protein